MVLVVLLTMILLAALLAASSQLTLSSRRTTADQVASLRAQYVAESGVAVAQSRLREIQSVLSKDNLTIPNGTTATTIRSYAEKYCGNSTWNDSTDGTTRTCTAQVSQAADQFEVFAQLISDSAYANLPTSERPTSLTAKRDYWKQQLSTAQKFSVNGATVGYSLVPTKVARLNNSSYRFYFQMDFLKVKGEQPNAVRVLKANRSNKTSWWIDISLPSYLDNVLFTNHHRSLSAQDDTEPNVNFTTQAFDGPVHTNEKFLFISNATASFSGRLSSAGCTNLPKIGMPSGGECSQAPGVYTSNGLKTAASSADTNDLKNASVLQQLYAQANPKLNELTRADGSKIKDATFTGSYRPMPVNASSQRAAAQGVTPPAGVTTDPDEISRYTTGRGLYFGEEVMSMTLSAGDANGVSPTTFNQNSKKWTPEPTYQHIKVLKGVEKQKVGTEKVCVRTNKKKKCTKYEYRDIYGSVEKFDFYRVNNLGSLEQKATNGTWAVVPDTASPSKPRPFNGTIFGEKGIESVTGPERHDEDQPAGPAVASFSQITVASETSDIGISGDLSLSDESCTKDLTACTDKGIEPPKNVLGIFSQKGNVLINKDAPDDLTIQAMLMSSEGQVTVDDYDDKTVGARGTVNLVGGLVENWYGAFGTVSGLTSVSGYGRNFSHDRRFQNPGFTPPFFPVSPTWVKKDGSEEGLALENFVMQQGTQADAP